MSLSVSSLCQLAGEAVSLYMRAAPDREVHLTPHDWLVLSGEPVADMNMGLVAGGPEPVERLRAFGQLLHQRRLPALIFLNLAVAGPLTPTAVSLGLRPAGSLPLMVRDTATVTTGANPYDVRQVTDENELAIANQLVADADDERLHGPEDPRHCPGG